MSPLTEVRIGIVGCGDILDAYMVGLARAGGAVGLADWPISTSSAPGRLRLKYEVPNVGSVEELFEDPEVDVVVSLTPPVIHDEIVTAAADAGKACVHREASGRVPHAG